MYAAITSRMRQHQLVKIGQISLIMNGLPGFAFYAVSKQRSHEIFREFVIISSSGLYSHFKMAR